MGSGRDVLLYHHPASICSQMARLALFEKHVQFRTHDVDILERDEQFDSWYLELNPKAVVPTLVVDSQDS